MVFLYTCVPNDGLFLHTYCVSLNLFWGIDIVFMPKIIFNFLEFSLPHYILLYIGGCVISCKYAERSLWVIQNDPSTQNLYNYIYGCQETFIVAL